MKKLAILTCALCVFATTAHAATQQTELKPIDTKRPAVQRPTCDIAKAKRAHEAAFEQKLGLTEVQKLKARELRKAGHEKMKPVMDDLRAKKREAESIRNSKLTVAEQEEKLTVIDKDIATLEKKAAEIRKQNMQDFEAILTKDQRKTLKQMKKDGREKFNKSHPQGPKPYCKIIPPQHFPQKVENK